MVMTLNKDARWVRRRAVHLYSCAKIQSNDQTANKKLKKI